MKLVLANLSAPAPERIIPLPYTYKYPHMAVTVDVVLFAKGSTPAVLLIQRAREPFKGCWALQGGFVDMDETAIDAAKRELQEETGLSGIDLKFLSYFDAIGRDPRERNLALAFCGVVERRLKVQAGDDASGAKWHSLTALPDLAFDHDLILKTAIKRYGRVIGR